MKVGIIGATGAPGPGDRVRLPGLNELRDELLGNTVPLLLSTGAARRRPFSGWKTKSWSSRSIRQTPCAGSTWPSSRFPPPRFADRGPPSRARHHRHRPSSASRATAPLFFDEATKPVNLAGAPLVALPSPESLAIARVLVALAPFEPRGVRATVLKAASGGGQAGVNNLAEGTGRLLNGQEPGNPLHGHRLAFNLIPQAGAFVGADTQSELNLASNLPKLLGHPIATTATVGWGPWFFGDFFSLSLQLASPVDAESIRGRLSDRPHLKVVDEVASLIYPMPSLATGDDAVLVGRLRPDPLDRQGFQLVAVMDGARASAAHAVEAFWAVTRARRAH